MAFDDVRLDDENCIEAVGGPGFRTEVIVLGSGVEQRNSRWPYPRRTWNIKYVARYGEDRFTSLIAFFKNRRGKHKGFRFKDWSDYEDDDAGYIEYVRGTLRLVKKYNDGFSSYVRPIVCPVLDTLVLPEGATFNAELGTVSGVDEGRWYGEFDVPVRFNTDEMKYKFTPDGIMQWEGVELIELVNGISENINEQEEVEDSLLTGIIGAEYMGGSATGNMVPQMTDGSLLTWAIGHAAVQNGTVHYDLGIQKRVRRVKIYSRNVLSSGMGFYFSNDPTFATSYYAAMCPQYGAVPMAWNEYVFANPNYYRYFRMVTLSAAVAGSWEISEVAVFDTN